MGRVGIWKFEFQIFMRHPRETFENFKFSRDNFRENLKFQKFYAAAAYNLRENLKMWPNSAAILQCWQNSLWKIDSTLLQFCNIDRTPSENLSQPCCEFANLAILKQLFLKIWVNSVAILKFEWTLLQFWNFLNITRVKNWKFGSTLVRFCKFDSTLLQLCNFAILECIYTVHNVPSQTEPTLMNREETESSPAHPFHDRYCTLRRSAIRWDTDSPA